MTTLENFSQVMKLNLQLKILILLKKCWEDWKERLIPRPFWAERLRRRRGVRLDRQNDEHSGEKLFTEPSHNSGCNWTSGSEPRPDLSLGPGPSQHWQRWQGKSFLCGGLKPFSFNWNKYYFVISGNASVERIEALRHRYHGGGRQADW